MKTFEQWLCENWGEAWAKSQDDRQAGKFTKPGTAGTSSNQVKDASKLKNPKSDIFTSIGKQDRSK